MKKLVLKEGLQDKKPTKAEIILQEARKDIKRFIAWEIPMLYKTIFGNTPDFGDGEEWTISTGDIGDIFIYVRDVSTPYSEEDKVYTKVEIAEIIMALDGSIILRDEDGNEWDDMDITLEELATVSDKIEKAYNKLIYKQ